MKIEITKRGSLYYTDIKDLPGSPYLGISENKEMSVALVFSLNRHIISKYIPNDYEINIMDS